MLSRHSVDIPFPKDEIANTIGHCEGNLLLRTHHYDFPGYHHGLHARQLQRAASEMVRPVSGSDGFHVSVDVHLFAPSELTVKTKEGTQFIFVEGKHEGREDEHGDVSRHFIRRYNLPNEYNINNVVAQLSTDGILSIRVAAPFIENDRMRAISIEHVGPACLFEERKKEAKENENEPENLNNHHKFY